MKRLLTLCIVLTAVALVAGPAFAEVQNVKVSGDVDSKMIYRADYDFLSDDTGATGANVKDNDTWFMTAARVQVDADLTDNVSTTLRLVNERDWDAETDATTDIDLDLASVTLKECLYSPLTLTVGRQNLRFGNGLVVGDPYTNDAESGSNRISADDLSVNKAFDAVRATLDYEPTVIDLVYAKIDADDIRRRAGSPGPRDDMDLWGINIAHDIGGQYDIALEGYFFSRLDRRNAGTDSAAVGGEDTCHVIGANGSVDLTEDLSVSSEIAYQFGDLLDTGPTPDRIIDRDALAFDIAAVYNGLSDSVGFLPGLSIRGGYCFRSGQGADSVDDDISDTLSEYSAWDPMFEDQTQGMIANYIFDGLNDGVGSNGHTINLGATAEPIEDLTLSLDYYLYSLDEKWVSTGAAGQNRTLSADGLSYAVKSRSDLGWELDLALDYAYTEDVTMGLACGWFFPGDAFDNAPASAVPDNNDRATEVIASLGVAF